jgi:hypothetical protein
MSAIELLQAVLHRACQSDDKELPVKIFNALLPTGSSFLQEVSSVYALYDNVLQNALSYNEYENFHICCSECEMNTLRFYGELLKSQGRDFLKAALHSQHHSAFSAAIDHNEGDGDIDILNYVVELYGQIDHESLNEALATLHYSPHGNGNHYGFGAPETIPREIRDVLRSLFQDRGMPLLDFDCDTDEGSDKECDKDSGDHINDVKILNSAPDCVACFETNVASHAFAPCGHMCLCFKCASAHKFSICPMCRSKGTPFAIRGAELE